MQKIEIIEAVLENREKFLSDIRFIDKNFEKNKNMNFHINAELYINGEKNGHIVRLLLKDNYDRYTKTLVKRLVVLDSSYNYIADSNNSTHCFKHWLKNVNISNEMTENYKIVLTNAITRKVIYSSDIKFYQIQNCNKYFGEIFFRLYLYKDFIKEFNKINPKSQN